MVEEQKVVTKKEAPLTPTGSITLFIKHSPSTSHHNNLHIISKAEPFPSLFHLPVILAMSEPEQPVYDASPIFDSLDVDLVLKVLSHTAFSPSKSIL